MKWNDALDDRLEELTLKGLMYKEIADEMGLSETQVLGRAKRLGFRRFHPALLPVERCMAIRGILGC